MSQVKYKDYSEISIDNLLSMTGQLPFGVYVQLSIDKFTLIFKKGDIVDKERFEHYSAKGVQQLYIHRSERRDYISATEVLVHKLKDAKEFNLAEAQKAIEELTEQTLFEIYEDKVFDEHSLRRTQTIIKSYIDILKVDPKNLATFINLSRQEAYPCRHAIATSVFSILLAKAAQNNNEKTLSIIGLGGLLHDLGMSKLPEDFDSVNRQLTPQEWAKVKSHPAMGIEMVNQLKGFPEEVKLVIEQHHEHWDGTGYPRGLRGPEIFYPARVVAIADAFSALTTRRGGRALYTPQDALALLLTESGKYDPALIKVFRTLFKVEIKKAS